MKQITRRHLITRAPLVALAFALLPKAWLLWLAPPTKPDLRQIGFAIKESLGFMVFTPTAVQRLPDTERMSVPYVLYEGPWISFNDVKNRRFDVEARSERLTECSQTT